jgi:hypothetical protein
MSSISEVKNSERLARWAERWRGERWGQGEDLPQPGLRPCMVGRVSSPDSGFCLGDLGLRIRVKGILRQRRAWTPHGCFIMIVGLGETESGSAGEQPDKG